MSFIVLTAPEHQRALYFLLLALMKHKMWPYFRDITLGAITVVPLLISFLLSVEHIQPTFALGACGHVCVSCVYCTKTPQADYNKAIYDVTIQASAAFLQQAACYYGLKRQSFLSWEDLCSLFPGTISAIIFTSVCESFFYL